MTDKEAIIRTAEQPNSRTFHNRLRVLYVPAGLFWGGASLSGAYMALSLQQRYNVAPVFLLGPHSIGTHPELFDLCTKNGCEFIFSAKHYGWTYRGSRIKGFIKLLLDKAYSHRKILHDLKGQHFDLVHSNGSFTQTGDIIAQHFGVPHVWHIRESITDHAGAHYTFSDEYVRSRYDASAANIAISQAVYDNVVNVHKYCSPRNTRMIYNGVKCPAPYEKSHCQGGRVNFVMSGWIDGPKNPLMAVKALQKLKPHTDKFTLHLVGLVAPHYEKYAEDLKQLIHSSSLDDHVKFWGWREDLPEVLKSMDVGLMLSKFEGFGRVTVEYMLNYMPVIGVDTGATPELVHHEDTGYICRFNDSDALAEYMYKFIAEPSLIRDMGQRARDYASSTFTVERNADEVWKVYQEILSL